jgi:sec-independent protein translocase protein TatC
MPPASLPDAARRARALPAMSDPHPPPDAPQESFLSHLFELRTRLVRAIVAVVVVLFCLFPWAKDIYAALAAPLLHALPKGATMIATDVTGTFFVPLKVTLMAAFLLALPYVLWQVWAFVAPGLYHHEKRLAIPVIVSSFVFFLIGMSFAYFVVFPIAFGFFASYTPEGVTMMTDIDKYLSFVLTMFIAFGITFEVPVVVIVLVRLGMVSLEKLRSIRSYVIVGAFVAGAIFTPPDVVSQLLLAVPLWLLYEFGMLMARFFVPPVGDGAAAEPVTGPADDARR